jgi:sensor domain CHASE-containing protein
MRTAFAFIALLTVTGCGVEVAGTAAVIGTAQVQEAEQAKKQLEHVHQRLDAAQHDMQQRMTAEGQ